MKFAIFVVVVFAFIAAVKSSGIPWIAGAPGSVAVQATLANGPVAAVALQTIPHAIAAPAAVAVAPAAAVAGPAATYIAKTRGVVHVAPLPGHVQSAASLNLQAAPGTA